MKNIVVLTGSPRKNGNTNLLAAAFAKGAKAAGHTVTVIDTAQLTIQGCRACNACYSKGEACVFNDDFNKIAPALEQAEAIVFATPLYWYSFTAQIKAVIDKIYALAVGKKTGNLKEFGLIVCGETTDEKDFEGIVKTYDIILNYLQRKDALRLVVPGVNQPGAVQNTNALQKAEELGRNI